MNHQLEAFYSKMSISFSFKKQLIFGTILVLVVVSKISLATTATTTSNNNNNNNILPLAPPNQQQLVNGEILDSVAAAAVGPARQRQQQVRVSPLLSALRFRRQINNAQQQLAQLSLLENDEQALRRQLPELIAQAHTDKSVERALLRMLISASLRSGLANIAQQSQAAWQQDGSGSAAVTSDQQQYNQQQQLAALGGSSNELFLPTRLARLDQNEYANLDNQNDLAQALSAQLTQQLEQQQQLQQLQQQQLQLQPALQYQQQQQQAYQAMDKREYIKPCSFNAISCVRTPFRRLK